MDEDQAPLYRELELNEVQQELLSWHLNGVVRQQHALEEAQASVLRFIVGVSGDERARVEEGPVIVVPIDDEDGPEE